MAASAVEVERLEREMQRCAAALEFEAAATVRDHLKALKAQLAAGEAEIQRLEAQLQQHVAALEFEAAAQLRDRIVVLRHSATSNASSCEGKGQLRRDPAKTVVVLRLPLTTTTTGLKAHFPSAAHINLWKDKKGRHMDGRIHFNSPTEAEAMAAKGELKLGKDVFKMRMAVDGGNLAPKEQRRVCLHHVPLNATLADLQQLLPTAVDITLRTGKSNADAFAVFRTAQEAEELAPGELELGGKIIDVEMCVDVNPMQQNKEEESRTVFFPHLPPTISHPNLEQRFSNAKTVWLVCRVKESRQPHTHAFVIFPTVEAALAIAQQDEVEVAGHSVLVKMADENKRQRVASVTEISADRKRQKP